LIDQGTPMGLEVFC